jgi:hypothetical protein
MGFLDKVKDTAKQVGEKAQQGVEAGKEKYEEKKLEKKIGDLKEELGGIVYAQRTGAAAEDAEAEITRIVAEISAAEAEIADLASEGEPAGDTPSGDESAAGATPEPPAS